MKGFIIMASFHAMMAVGHLQAQDIAKCEYWIDSDYGKRVETSGPAVSMSFSVPLEEYAPGLHFFNFRAVNSAGEVGNLMRTMLYLPETQPKEVGIVCYESWIDDDFGSRVQARAEGKPALTVDVDGLAPGLHFFNFRAVNSVGEVGNLMRTMFYLPEEIRQDVSGYEYWIDDDVDNSTFVDGNGCNIYMSIDVSSFMNGEHTFNFRAKNSFGHWGPVCSETFIIDETTDIESIEQEDTVFNVYSIAGLMILKNATKKELSRLPSSVYIVNGKKVLVM